MHQEHGTLNGYPALYLIVGEIRADVKHLHKRVDSLERAKTTLLADLLPYLTGLVVLVLAAAGKWTMLGDFLHAYAK